MVLTVSFVLFPVIGLSCHRHLADTSAKLDAGVEASEPHDFAVRLKRRSSIAPSASIASHPALMTLRNAPLWNRTARMSELIWVKREEEYFCGRGWTGKSAERLICPSGKSLSLWGAIASAYCAERLLNRRNTLSRSSATCLAGTTAVFGQDAYSKFDMLGAGCPIPAMTPMATRFCSLTKCRDVPKTEVASLTACHARANFADFTQKRQRSSRSAKRPPLCRSRTPRSRRAD
jgi:hypothetical protein